MTHPFNCKWCGRESDKEECDLCWHSRFSIDSNLSRSWQIIIARTIFHYISKYKGAKNANSNEARTGSRGMARLN